MIPAMTLSALILSIPLVALTMSFYAYRMGRAASLRELEERRVSNIKAVHRAWRAGMLAERMRQFSPKDVSKN